MAAQQPEDIVAVTGATATSVAVVSGVNAALAFCRVYGRGSKVKRKILFAAVMMIVLLLAGCAGSQGEQMQEEQQPVADTNAITLAGEDLGEVTVLVSDMKKMTAVTRDVVAVDSSGDENPFAVKGALLDDVLATVGKKQRELGALRFVAGDGYMIEVPHEILAARDVILAYEINGEPLQERTRPVRAVIPEERAMYWVRNLIRIELLAAGKAMPIEKLFLLDSAVATMQLHDYTYYEAVDKAVSAGDLFAGVTEGDTVCMKSSDGLEKNEKSEVFASGYLKVTGEEVPAFVSPDLPKGMYVKDILWLSKAQTGYFSVAEGFGYFTLVQQDGQEGIALSEILAEVGMADSPAYLFTASDGYSAEIAQADIEKGVLYLNESGEPAVYFAGLPKNTNVKGLLSIEVKQE